MYNYIYYSFSDDRHNHKIRCVRVVETDSPFIEIPKLIKGEIFFCNNKDYNIGEIYGNQLISLQCLPHAEIKSLETKKEVMELIVYDLL